MTGAPGFIICLDNFNNDVNKYWEAILKHYKKGYLLESSTTEKEINYNEIKKNKKKKKGKKKKKKGKKTIKLDADRGLSSNHAYSILNIQTVTL